MTVSEQSGQFSGYLLLFKHVISHSPTYRRVLSKCRNTCQYCTVHWFVRPLHIRRYWRKLSCTEVSYKCSLK